MKPEILLKAYVLHQSEDAFRELVATSVDEVYSSALRVVQGAPHLAEETALRVYWRLARKAPGLVERVPVASWLREQTCKTAAIVLRENGRSPDRVALKKEMRAVSVPNGIGAAPPGLATRVCQGILLNAARNKSFLQFSWPAHSWPVLWPTWIRPVHIRAVAVCILLIIVLWNVPFHKTHPIVLSTTVHLTPASFAQLGNADEDNLPAGGVPETQIKTIPNQK